jgi:hypothetical protein
MVTFNPDTQLDVTGFILYAVGAGQEDLATDPNRNFLATGWYVVMIEDVTWEVPPHMIKTADPPPYDIQHRPAREPDDI